MAHRLPLADIQFIADFAAFCRTKGDEAYEFWNFDRGECGCAVTQFTHSRGEEFGGGDWVRAHLLAEAVVDQKPQTFPALATRLDALIVNAPAVAPSATEGDGE